jgi:hypothetical protein
MKRLVFILFAFYNAPAFCQSADTVKSFKIKLTVPHIKRLYSLSNTLYIGSNPLILEGIDSASASKYMLFASAFAPISRRNGTFVLELSDWSVVHGIAIPGTLAISISRIQGNDTLLVGKQVFPIETGGIEMPRVMIGKEILTPDKINKKMLLQHPTLLLVSDSKDYNDSIKISRFEIKIGNRTMKCSSALLTGDIISLLQKYGGEYVSIDNIYIMDAEGESLYYSKKMKKD